MIDINLIRKNPEVVRKNLKRRKDPEKIKLLDFVIEYDKKWRETLQRVDTLKHKKNLITKTIAQKKGEGRDTEKEIQEMKNISDEIKAMEEETEKYKEKLHHGLMKLPNLLHESVPYGESEEDNVEIRRWGKPRKFDFKPKNHFDILLDLGLIDSERGAKVSGTGFYYLRDELVLLDYALMKFAMDFLIKRGYTLIEPPYMLRRRPYEGVTDLAEFETVQYKIEGEDLRLISTSEHPMAAMFMDEVLLEEDLPLKFVGVSPCFRKEIGAHGKYTKGLFRMHQFNKVEQFIFSKPEESWRYHEELQENSERLLQKLGLPYRVVNICTGDIGIVAAKKYDNEIWMVDNKYREVGSNSNCTDFQARRLNIRYREEEGKPPRGYVHTLNNTGLATSRVMIAIIENYQQEDGSVIIPKVLWSYMNGIKKLERKE
jgi:seryl-tRNA synthetase